MEKTFSTLPSSSSSDTQAEMVVEAPPRKLDAEDYHAEDQEGVTQSLFGSGNLNYLTLQERQTDALLAGSGLGAATGKGEMDMLAGGYAAGAAHRFIDGVSGGPSRDGGDIDFSSAGSSAALASASNARAFQNDIDAKTAADLQSPQAPQAVASFGTATQDGGGFNGRDGGDARPGRDGTNGHDGTAGPTGPAGAEGTGGTNGSNGSNGANGSNGSNGADGAHGGHEGCGDGGINIVINLPGGDGGGCVVTPVIDTVTNIVNNAGDTVTHVVNNAGDTVTHVVENAGDAVTNIVQTTTNVIDSVGDTVATLPETVTQVVQDTTQLLGDVVHDLPEVLNGAAGAAGGLVNAVAELPDTLVQTVGGVTDGVQDILSPVTAGLADLPQTLESVIGGLLGGTPGDGDTDILLTGNTGLPPLEVNLDPVENLLGDIDVTLGLSHDAQGLGIDLTAQALGIQVPEISLDAGGLMVGAPAAGGDTDLSLLNDIGLPQVVVGLDPVENIVGDIDASLGISHGDDGITVDLAAQALGIQLPEISLGTETPPAGSDTDLSVLNDLGLPQVNVGLDPVESVVGDIDLTLGLSHEQDGILVDLNAQALGVELPEISLGTETPPAGSDTDLSVLNDLGLPQVNVGLDPVESILGDIDVSAGLAHDADSLSIDLNVLALGDALPPVEIAVPTALSGDLPCDIGDTVSNTLSGITDQAAAVESVADTAISLLASAPAAETPLSAVTDTVGTLASTVSTAASWTETAVTDTASTVGGLVDTVVSSTGLAAALPEPTGVVSSGLSLLGSLTDTHHSSGGGGLFGHHGGLF